MPGQQPAQGRRTTPAARAIPPAPAVGCDAAWRARGRRRRPRTGRTTRRTGRRRPRAARPRPSCSGGARTGRPGSGPEWVAGRNAVLEAMEAEIPIKAAYVAEGAERDDRLREILKLAAARGTALLEVTRLELDRLTGGAVHQGVALQLPAYEYAHPDDLLATALAAEHRAADRRPRLGHRPAQPGRDRPVGRGVRRPRGADPGAPLGRHDRRGLEDLRRGGRPDPDRPRHQPQPHAARLRRRRAEPGRPGRVGAHRPRRLGRRCRGRWCWWSGSEGEGLSRLVREACDTVAAIPIAATVESLNAGVAAGHRAVRDFPAIRA